MNDTEKEELKTQISEFARRKNIEIEEINNHKLCKILKDEYRDDLILISNKQLSEIDTSDKEQKDLIIRDQKYRLIYINQDEILNHRSSITHMYIDGILSEQKRYNSYAKQIIEKMHNETEFNDKLSSIKEELKNSDHRKKILIVGAGPVGLLASILLKNIYCECDVELYEGRFYTDKDTGEKKPKYSRKQILMVNDGNLDMIEHYFSVFGLGSFKDKFFGEGKSGCYTYFPPVDPNAECIIDRSKVSDKDAIVGGGILTYKLETTLFKFATKSGVNFHYERLNPTKIKEKIDSGEYKLVIGAEGFNSQVRQLVTSLSNDYVYKQTETPDSYGIILYFKPNDWNKPIRANPKLLDIDQHRYRAFRSRNEDNTENYYIAIQLLKSEKDIYDKLTEMRRKNIGKILHEKFEKYFLENIEEYKDNPQQSSNVIDFHLRIKWRNKLPKSISNIDKIINIYENEPEYKGIKEYIKSGKINTELKIFIENHVGLDIFDIKYESLFSTNPQTPTDNLLRFKRLIDSALNYYDMEVENKDDIKIGYLDISLYDTHSNIFNRESLEETKYKNSKFYNKDYKSQPYGKIFKINNTEILAILAGDSAFGVHFFSGTGVNNGFQEIRWLISLMSSSLDQKTKNERILRAYSNHIHTIKKNESILFQQIMPWRSVLTWDQQEQLKQKLSKVSPKDMELMKNHYKKIDVKHNLTKLTNDCNKQEIKSFHDNKRKIISDLEKTDYLDELDDFDKCMISTIVGRLQLEYFPRSKSLRNKRQTKIKDLKPT